MSIANSHTFLGLAAALISLAAAQPASAQIVNGSFEQGTFVNNGSGAESLGVGATVITGWTTTNAELAWITTPNSYGLTTPYGSYFLDLTGYHDSSPYGGVTQSLATTNGASYHLSFSLGADQSNSSYAGPVGATASAGATSQSFTFTPGVDSAGNQWATFGFDFTATGTSTPVTITGILSTGGQYIGLDNVSVTPNSPVPEVSMTVSLGLLLALGLGGVVLTARKKRIV